MGGPHRPQVDWALCWHCILVNLPWFRAPELTPGALQLSSTSSCLYLSLLTLVMSSFCLDEVRLTKPDNHQGWHQLPCVYWRLLASTDVSLRLLSCPCVYWRLLAVYQLLCVYWCLLAVYQLPCVYWRLLSSPCVYWPPHVYRHLTFTDVSLCPMASYVRWERHQRSYKWILQILTKERSPPRHHMKR